MSLDTVRVSVLMPSFEQAHFIRRALDSLAAQSFTHWEAVIVDDGSLDHTLEAVAPWLADERIRYVRLAKNAGLGAALNAGLEQAVAPLVAYLPSDDVWYRDHLAQLVACLDAAPQAVLACSGVRHHYNRSAPAQIPGSWLQLVQCLHRRTPDRWVERAELESDDLDRLFWNRLRTRGDVVATGNVTCEWVDHPLQRHKLMQEPVGGINPFRQHYRVGQPLRFHTSVGNAIDEAGQYHHMRARAGTPLGSTGLKILLVGELAYNADRVLALEEQGHAL
jgi:glycosyltransferase involved in cell wall biosynthesis